MSATVSTVGRGGARPPARAGQSVVAARQLTRSFGGRSVLDGLDLTIRPGEFVALIGRSGSGKSTVLRALAGLDAEVGGQLDVTGAVAIAFQDPRLLPWRRVAANVALGLREPDPRAVALEALREVDLEAYADAWPRTLSGGEAQRVSLARALVHRPSLLLLDEPFSALDALTRITMHRLVSALWTAHQPAVLLVTHDVDEALLLADRVLVLADGRVGHEVTVTSPRPRDGADHELAELRTQLLTQLGVQPEGNS
jgi:sulfonate transport system ATP-binding protein